MENETGIAVGITHKHGKSSTTSWYAAHSLLSLHGGSFTIFGRDNGRTQYVISAKQFAGVCPGIRDAFSGKLFPDISEYKEVS